MAIQKAAKRFFFKCNEWGGVFEHPFIHLSFLWAACLPSPPPQPGCLSAGKGAIASLPLLPKIRR